MRIFITGLCAVGIVAGIFVLRGNTFSYVDSTTQNQNIVEEKTDTSPQNIEKEIVRDPDAIYYSDTPILAYHTTAPYLGTETAEQKRFKISPEALDQQFAYLKERGFTVIPLDDLVSYLRNGEPTLPEKSIVLTFDDGLESQYDIALPILEKYDYTATFFVYTLTIGKKRFMTWDEVRELYDKGMTIGGHSKTHAMLTKIEDEKILWDEIGRSKEIIEENLGHPIYMFAYPFYSHNEHVEDALEKAGYWSALAGWKKVPNSTQELFSLSRLEAPTTLEGLKKIVR